MFKKEEKLYRIEILEENGLKIGIFGIEFPV